MAATANVRERAATATTRFLMGGKTRGIRSDERLHFFGSGGFVQAPVEACQCTALADCECKIARVIGGQVARARKRHDLQIVGFLCTLDAKPPQSRHGGPRVVRINAPPALGA